MISGHLGVIANFVVSPESSTVAPAVLVQETVGETPGTGVSRIESLPAYQRQGVGRLLVSYGWSRLAELGFNTISLIVTRTNWRARRMYQVIGFQSVLSFPVFAWGG